MRMRTVAAAVAVCALAVTGCGKEGSSDDAVSDVEETATFADAEGVVLDYLAKSLSGDPAACELESATFSDEQNEMNGTETCTDRIKGMKEMIAAIAPDLDVRDSKVVVTAGEGGSAIAEVVHDAEGFSATMRLVLRDGSWVIDEEVQEDAATGSASGAATGDDAQALAWEQAFCRVTVGTTRSDLELWMGAPTEETITDGQVELGWYVSQDSYTVWLKDDDTVDTYSSSTPRETDFCIS